MPVSNLNPEVVVVHDYDRIKRYDLENSDDDEKKKKSRIRCLKKKAINASTKLLRKRSNRIAHCRFESVLDEDFRDEKEVEAVNSFRKALIRKDLLPSRDDDYNTMLRFLKAREFDPDKAIFKWAEMLNWRKEYGVDSTIEETIRRSASICGMVQEADHGAVLEDSSPPYRASGAVQRRLPKKSILGSMVDMMIKSIAWIWFLLHGLRRLVLKNDVQNILEYEQRSVNVSPREQNVSSLQQEDLLHPCCERLQHLEEVVAKLVNKPTKLPPEKELLLLDSMNRIKSIEYDLGKTKKALIATASRQVEVTESLESLKANEFKRTNSSWLRTKSSPYKA